jgi:protein-S-isoprenylcysteine O-methyltransferase Ste14
VLKVTFVSRWQRPESLTESANNLESRSTFLPSDLGTWRLTIMILCNVVGALGALLFARSGFLTFRRTHSLIGFVFLAEELWIVAAYLIRRRAKVVTQRLGDWLVAFAGTYAGVLFRPQGAHPHWGVVTGLVLQIIGLVICVASFSNLGRSFGFAAADRGIKTRGTYSVVRHPIYASYIFLLLGYVLQSISIRNVIVMLTVLSFDAGRVVAEERLLNSNSSYLIYRHKVRWRVIPGLW